jgi:GntR family transcriptional repressor for pyruvate dehydrogenase complex
LLTSLHGLDPCELFEVRLALEMAGAGLAAERATGDQLADMAEEVAEMYASVDDPVRFLAHGASFRRLVVHASGNRALIGLVSMLGPVAFDLRGETGWRAQVLREWAGTHREIYRAIRRRDQTSARAAVQDYWLRSRRARLLRF